MLLTSLPVCCCCSSEALTSLSPRTLEDMVNEWVGVSGRKNGNSTEVLERVNLVIATAVVGCSKQWLCGWKAKVQVFIGWMRDKQ